MTLAVRKKRRLQKGSRKQCEGVRLKDNQNDSEKDARDEIDWQERA
jgi:hypothetical protein